MKEIIESFNKNRNLILLKYGIDWDETQIKFIIPIQYYQGGALNKVPIVTFVIKLGRDFIITDEVIFRRFDNINIHIRVFCTNIERDIISRNKIFSQGKKIWCEKFFNEVIIVVGDMTLFDDIFSTLLYLR